MTLSEAVQSADFSLLDSEPKEVKRLVKLCDGGDPDACAEALQIVWDELEEPDGPLFMLTGLLGVKGCQLRDQRLCNRLSMLPNSVKKILDNYLFCVAPSSKGGQGSDLYTRVCIRERMDCGDIDRESSECTILTYMTKHSQRLDWEQICKLLSESCLSGDLQACRNIGRLFGDESQWSQMLQFSQQKVQNEGLSDSRRLGLVARHEFLRAMDSQITPQAKVRGREVYNSAVDSIEVLKNAVIEYHAAKCTLPPPPRINIESSDFRQSDRNDHPSEKRRKDKVEKFVKTDQSPTIQIERDAGCRPCDPGSVRQNHQAVEALGAVLPRADRTCLTYEYREDSKGLKSATIQAVQDLNCDGFMAKFEGYIKAENEDSPCLFQNRTALYTLNEGN